MHFIFFQGNRLPPVLYLQADNCVRENKNQYVIGFCELLVKEHIFNEVGSHESGISSQN